MQCMEPEAGTSGQKSHPSPLSLPPTLFFLQARMVQQATPLSARRPRSRFCLHFCKSVTRDLLFCSDSTKQNLPFSANRRARTRVSFLWALAGNCASTDGRNFLLWLFFFLLLYFHFPRSPSPSSFLHHCKDWTVCPRLWSVVPLPHGFSTHTCTHVARPLSAYCVHSYIKLQLTSLSCPLHLPFTLLSRPLCHYTNSGPLCAVW